MYLKSMRIFLYLCGDIYGIYGKIAKVFGVTDISGENVSYFNYSVEINTKVWRSYKEIKKVSSDKQIQRQK